LFCSRINSYLPVPQTNAENEFITKNFGETFLGIKGELNGGVVTWKNIYTQVLYG